MYIASCNLNMKVNIFWVLPTGKKTEGDSRFDEEKTWKSSSGWQNIKMAFSNKFYPAQHCLLGPIRRPRPMVNKTKNFIFRFFATLYSGKRRETFKEAREIFCTNGEKSFCESILRLLTATLKYNEQANITNINSVQFYDNFFVVTTCTCAF